MISLASTARRTRNTLVRQGLSATVMPARLIGVVLRWPRSDRTSIALYLKTKERRDPPRIPLESADVSPNENVQGWVQPEYEI